MRRRRVRWDRIVGFVLLVAVMGCLVHSVTKEKTPAATSAGIVTEPTETETLPPDLFTVVIDPGHGGTDVGTHNADETRLEKDDNLDAALLLRDALQKIDSDINVILTRDDDTFISLADRCEIANTQLADLFVSLHRNSATEGNGVEIWVNSGPTDAEQLLANNLLTALDTVGISRNRGIREGFRENEGGGTDYYVNGHTSMPSCLIELGFLSDTTDNADFDTKLTQYAAAMAEAVVATGRQLGLYGTDDITTAGTDTSSTTTTETT